MSNDFVGSNVSAPITIEEIARASGISGRNLQLRFQQFRGMSPLRFLRQIRLDGVHRALTRNADHGSISQIAQQ
jgi:transcriptional regulator GlxA family with amidase domain